MAARLFLLILLSDYIYRLHLDLISWSHQLNLAESALVHVLNFPIVDIAFNAQLQILPWLESVLSSYSVVGEYNLVAIVVFRVSSIVWTGQIALTVWAACYLKQRFFAGLTISTTTTSDCIEKTVRPVPEMRMCA
jgi:hypothetical protein